MTRRHVVPQAKMTFIDSGHEAERGTMDSRQFYQGFADMNQPLELILGNLTAAMCILSALFMRFAWMVQPCNYVLLACHVSDETLQLYQLSRWGKGEGFGPRGSARNNGFQTILSDSGQEAERGTMDSRQFWVCGHELTPGTDFGQHDSRALERLCVFLASQLSTSGMPSLE